MTTDQPAESVDTQKTSGASGESLLMIGATLVLVVYVVLELLAGEYFQSWQVIVASAFVLLLSRFGSSAVSAIGPIPAVLKLLGYVVALSGLVEGLDDLRFGRLDEFIEIIGALVAYAGYVLAFLGARAIDV